MTEKKPDSIGSFLGLITKEGKLRMQMRIEKESITGISYQGEFELTGGKIKEEDLKKALTVGELLREAIREGEEELGIEIKVPFLDFYAFYRAVYKNPKTGKIDWAFMVPIVSEFWDETVSMKRKTVDVNPDELNILGELNLVVSGKKRMWRMSQGALYLSSTNPDWRQKAEELLSKVKPDWKSTELLIDPTRSLAEIRSELGLEK